MNPSLLLAFAAAMIAIVGGVWTFGVWVFQPRLKDTIESTIRETVNGKIDRIEAKVDQLHADQQQQHLDVEKQLAVGSHKMQTMSSEIDRLRNLA